MNAITRVCRWALGEAWEKINVRAKWEEIKEQGKKHGTRFVVFAVLWECIEDGLFPFLAIRFGMPALAPFFLIMHFEPLVYPVFFWACRMYDRARGREPWEPDRTAQSSNLRSAGKVVVYKLAVIGWCGMILMGLGYSPKILLVFAALMAAFGFIHERIWHDSNYGIGDNGAGDIDHVFVRRTAMKTVTYCIVSTTVLASLFRVAFMSIPWSMLVICQAVGMGLYFIFEAVWARSKWGVSPVSRPSPVPLVSSSFGEAVEVTVISDAVKL